MCHHEERRQIDADLLPTEPFRRVSLETIGRRYGLSPRSLGRHRDEHLAPQVSLGIQRQHEDIRIGQLVDRVLAQVGAAADIRDHAMREGDGRLALLASREERDAVTFLVDRLGIANDGARAELAEGVAFKHAVFDLLGKAPELAEVAAKAVEQTGQEEMAAALRSLGEAHLQRRAAGDPSARLQLVRPNNEETP
ncbi:hypothetical protein [Geodermatophilus sp. Leaf369]|uniref:hypothetical protein n=1 Tax=Geodermatophilus sp. Leaf369 TaxID=1736354 RepID=UPI0012FACA47|nr:hypothetical protein [Geodermatophilus sp. Leaf369]